MKIKETKNPQLKGKLYIIVGARGVGKSLLSNLITNKLYKLNLSLPCPVFIAHFTNRQKRPEEFYSVNYYYMPYSEMLSEKKKGHLEYVVKYPNKNYYVALMDLEPMLKAGQRVFVIISSVQRLYHLIEKYPSHIIFIDSHIANTMVAINKRDNDESKFTMTQLTNQSKELFKAFLKIHKSVPFTYIANDFFSVSDFTEQKYQSARFINLNNRAEDIIRLMTIGDLNGKTDE